MTIFTFLRGLFIIWLVLYALSRFGPPLHAATNDSASLPYRTVSAERIIVQLRIAPGNVQQCSTSYL